MSCVNIISQYSSLWCGFFIFFLFTWQWNYGFDEKFTPTQSRDSFSSSICWALGIFFSIMIYFPSLLSTPMTLEVCDLIGFHNCLCLLHAQQCVLCLYHQVWTQPHQYDKHVSHATLASCVWFHGMNMNYKIQYIVSQNWYQDLHSW